MSAVGLTKAMRAALETRQFSDVMFKRAQEMGFIDEFSNYYPRATAALAAPRMTQKEFDLLEDFAGERTILSFMIGAYHFNSLLERGWIIQFDDEFEGYPIHITPCDGNRELDGIGRSLSNVRHTDQGIG